MQLQGVSKYAVMQFQVQLVMHPVFVQVQANPNARFPAAWGGKPHQKNPLRAQPSLLDSRTTMQ